MHRTLPGLTALNSNDITGGGLLLPEQARTVPVDIMPDYFLSNQWEKERKIRDIVTNAIAGQEGITREALQDIVLQALPGIKPHMARDVLQDMLRCSGDIVCYDGNRYGLCTSVNKAAVCRFLEAHGPANLTTLYERFRAKNTSAKKRLKTLVLTLVKQHLVRTGKNRTWVFSGASSGRDSLYAALDMDIDWDGSRLAAEDSDESAEQNKGQAFYVSGTYAPGGELDSVQLDPNEAGISKAKIASFDALNQPLLPGDRLRLKILPEKEAKGRGSSKQHRWAECTGILAWTTEPIKMLIRRVNVWGAEAFSLEVASGRLFRSFRLDAESLARFRSVLEKIPKNMSAHALLYPRGRTRVSVEMHMEQAPRLPLSISEQEYLVRMGHSVPGDFPDAVLAEARRLPEELSDKDREGRLDLREQCFVTIDGADARDFDDAICVEEERDGSFVLAVAIADVSHYVRFKSNMDMEALQRGNSWYFPTSVTPMLPFALSHNLCSLVPHQDRLVMVARLQCTREGEVRSARFAEGILCSAARLTYDEARSLVLDHDQALCARFSPKQTRGQDVVAMLTRALTLARLMYRRRMERGALDFDLPDTEATFDSEGLITSLKRSSRHEMHRLIEEFMLAANEAVADFLQSKELPFLYRTHPCPPEEKLFRLRMELQALGLMERPLSSVNLPAIIAKVRGTAFEHIVNRLCVRSLSFARYSDVNAGHYGLASKAYCHFTSPIRRYADLLVHRVLKKALGRNQDPIPAGARLMRTAQMLNDAEREAQLCEREMNKRLACLWMMNRNRKEELSATVTSIEQLGIFVELDDAPVEGLIRAEDLQEPYRMAYDGSRDLWTIRHKKRRWLPGAQCRVSLKFVDMGRLYINFRLHSLD